MGVALPGLQAGLLNQSSAQVIDGSLKFESGLQTYLKRTNSSSGNRKTWTLSVWMKRNLSNATFYQSFFINRTSASYNIRFNRNTSTENNTYFGLGGGALTGSRKFRDTGWFHAVLVYDTTNATEADRIKWYINGQREANFSAATYPSQNTDGEFNRNQEYGIGYYNTNTAWDGSMSQYYFIDGQALGPESFGYTDGLTNTWRPKKYTGTFGTNGFYLPMDGNSPITEDKSGNGNNWTAVNFSGTFNDPDVLKDSPSGAVSGGRAQTGITTTSSAPSNYATMNPLQMSPNRTPTISDGNLSISLSSGSSEWTNTGCTMSIGSGKYYWEVQFTTINGIIARVGVADSDDYEFNRNTGASGLPWLGSGTGKSWSLDVGGRTYHNGSTVNGSYTSTIITSDIIGVLLDLDNNTLSFSKNGTNLGVAHSNVTSDFVTPGFGLHGATTNTINVNFGQKPFKYAPLQGFLPLNSASATPETVIARPDHYVGITTWKGNGVTGLRTINADFKFKPDFVWEKVRTGTDSHILYDSVRGYGASKALKSNSTVAEGQNDNATYGYVNSVFNGGIEIFGGSSAASDSFTNENNQDMVAWSWKAGGNKNTFNVDDVGYANASDVNMSVGSLNSVSYDKSVTWSSTSGMSTPANAFDGSFSTGATVSSSGSPITVTTGSFTASSISFYKNGNNDANLATITINDTSVFSFPLQSTATGWVTVNIGSEVTVTSLKTTWYGAYTLYAVKYDTKLLVDNGTATQNVPSTAPNGASVGTKQGFSIIKWTGTGSGTSLGHGLGSAPDFVIVKSLANAREWLVWHSSFNTASNTDYIYLNTTGDKGGSGAGDYWNNSAPTSTTFSVGNSAAVNSGGDFIAYLWHDVPGLQKFGTYTGSSGLPFVECGFRPAVIILKKYDGTDKWCIYDTARGTFNTLQTQLHPDTNDAETINFFNFDILSNGFRPMDTSGQVNENGKNYIFAAWAETPTFNLYGGQSNAR